MVMFIIGLILLWGLIASVSQAAAEVAFLLFFVFVIWANIDRASRERREAPLRAAEMEAKKRQEEKKRSEHAAKVAAIEASLGPARMEEIRLEVESWARPKGRTPIPLEVKREVFERDGGMCQGCGTTFDIQYDHITPYSRGGSSEPGNLQLLCGTCNRRKGARTDRSQPYRRATGAR